MVESVQAGTLNTGPKSTDSVGSSALGKDEFLKLLMAQMANQDPTEPQSSEQFIAQLAQFAALESSQQMGRQLEGLLIATAAQNQLAAADLVGKDVTFAAESLVVKDGVSSTVELNPASAADEIIVIVTDKDGNEVSRETLKGPFDGSSVSYTWGAAGTEDGEYTVTATATADGKPVDVQILTRHVVDGVTYASGAPVLIVGAHEIAMNEVIEVLNPTEP